MQVLHYIYIIECEIDVATQYLSSKDVQGTF